MNAINDDDFRTPLREIDIQNIERRLEWERRKRYGFLYRDIRGELTGAELDAKHAQKLRLARHFLNAIIARKERRKVWPANVSMFHRKQAT